MSEIIVSKHMDVYNSKEFVATYMGFILNTIPLKFKKLHPDAKIPERAHPSDSGMDLSSIEDVTIEPGTSKVVGTGLAVGLPNGIEGQVRSRSGLAAKNTVFVLNSPGTVDSSYTGEIKVILMNVGKDPFVIHKGDRIAQLCLGVVLLLPLIQIVEDLDETDRGDGGLGSTGVK